jgi:uncharacterized protein YutE (UPF0331/DUF86 family)
LGLELAEIRTRGQETNARLDLDALSRVGVIGPERGRRLQRLRELRLLVHEYATATAEQVHEAARIVSNEFIAFYDAYRAWIGRGFSSQPPT